MSPEGFTQCVNKGGKVRTVSGPNNEHGLKRGQYMHYCVLDGKSYRGEVKTRKSKAHEMVGRD